MPFLHTTSEGTTLRKFIHVPSLTKRALKVETQEQIDICKSSGFRIRYADSDMQFEFIKDEFEEVEVDIVDADNHVEDIERDIRKIKEGTRGLVQGVLFKKMSKLIAKTLVEVATRHLNLFPAENGTSDILSPLTIVTRGATLDAHNF